jgi:hypothetical protein
MAFHTGKNKLAAVNERQLVKRALNGSTGATYGNVPSNTHL